MANITRLTDVTRVQNTVLTVGTFDGVHIGHQTLIQKVVERADHRDARSVIVTFDPHPRDIINPGEKGIRLLTTLDERMEILNGMGVDEMIVIPFTRDFSLLSSSQFIREVVWELIGVSEFVIGYDHHFGRDREGGIQTIEQLSEELGFDVFIVSKQEVENRKVSSTLIRDLLETKGDVKRAASLLGHSYVLNGTVVKGEGRGGQTGYPTANITPGHPNKSIPRDGVYAVKADVGSQSYKGMMNIGFRPTFEGITRSLEVHIFDFNSDIYGQQIRIRFIDRLRGEKKFNSIDELSDQLSRDKSHAEELLGLKNESL